MAVTGAVLVLFVTFHCLMNAIAICWPTAYNSICMFLGANWYALLASAVLAAFIVVHIIYAVVLTCKNRNARGDQRYAISKRPATVEWSSNNMLVLGIVILAFLVVHLIQFWAKMQLQEIRGAEEVIPPTAGTLFIQEAFSQIFTPIVYIIGFVALWFHLNHGVWSMFQSVGWDSNVWIPRLKKIACWWSSIVVLCFICQAIVFTVRSHEDYYKTNPELRQQYLGMLTEMYERDFGPDAMQSVPSAQIFMAMKQGVYPFEMIAEQGIRQAAMQAEANPISLDDPQIQQQMMNATPEERENVKKAIDANQRANEAWIKMKKFVDFLENRPEENLSQMQMMPGAPQGQPQGKPQGQPQQAPQDQPQQAPQGQPQDQPQQAPQDNPAASTPQQGQNADQNAKTK